MRTLPCHLRVSAQHRALRFFRKIHEFGEEVSVDHIRADDAAGRARAGGGASARQTPAREGQDPRVRVRRPCRRRRCVSILACTSRSVAQSSAEISRISAAPPLPRPDDHRDRRLRPTRRTSSIRMLCFCDGRRSHHRHRHRGWNRANRERRGDDQSPLRRRRSLHATRHPGRTLPDPLDASSPSSVSFSFLFQPSRVVPVLKDERAPSASMPATSPRRRIASAIASRDVASAATCGTRALPLRLVRRRVHSREQDTVAPRRDREGERYSESPRRRFRAKSATRRRRGRGAATRGAQRRLQFSFSARLDAHDERLMPRRDDDHPRRPGGDARDGTVKADGGDGYRLCRVAVLVLARDPSARRIRRRVPRGRTRFRRRPPSASTSREWSDYSSLRRGCRRPPRRAVRMTSSR